MNQSYTTTNECCNIYKHFCTNFNVFDNPVMFFQMLDLCSLASWRRSRQIETCRSYDRLCVKYIILTLVHLLVLLREYWSQLKCIAQLLHVSASVGHLRGVTSEYIILTLVHLLVLLREYWSQLKCIAQLLHVSASVGHPRGVTSEY